MAFEKYDIIDGFQAQLDTWISASTTTITLKTGEGWAMVNGSQKTILKFVQYSTPSDPTSAISKFENVLVINRSWDTLTVTRWFWGTTPTWFNGDDFVYATNHTEITVDLQEELERIEDDKLDDGDLRSWMTAWRLMYTNVSWNEKFLWFGSNGSYLKSTWASSAPVWDNPPLDINGQTSITSTANSYLVPVYTGSANRKVSLLNFTKWLAQANSSRLGVAEIATDAEFEGKTDISRIPTTASIWKYYPRTPGTTSFSIANAEFPTQSYSTNSTSFTTVDSFTSLTGWTYRVIFDISWTSGANAYHQILVNGSVQAEFETSWALIQDNIFFIHVWRGNTVSIQLRTGSGSNPAVLYGYNITSD